MPKQGVNPDVHWDKTYKTNFGIDMAFLKNRMSANLDFYYDMAVKCLLHIKELLIIRIR